MVISLINELSLLSAPAYFEINRNRDINCIEAFREYLEKPGRDTVTCMEKSCAERGPRRHISRSSKSARCTLFYVIITKYYKRMCYELICLWNICEMA